MALMEIGSIIISIHAPREGGDFAFSGKAQTSRLFQSTPPARGATTSGCKSRIILLISIHAPREGGDKAGRLRSSGHFIFQSTPPARGATQVGQPVQLSQVFQSTPPARGATEDSYMSNIDKQFQSTPPARGATGHDRPMQHRIAISIHAPREGGDLVY